MLKMIGSGSMPGAIAVLAKQRRFAFVQGGCPSGPRLLVHQAILAQVHQAILAPVHQVIPRMMKTIMAIRRIFESSTAVIFASFQKVVAA